jgi:CheY-specific phosphatase CheX
MSRQPAPGQESDDLIESLLSGQTFEEAPFEIIRSERYSILSVRQSPERGVLELVRPGPDCLLRTEDSLILVRLEMQASLSPEGVRQLRELLMKVEASGKKLGLVSATPHPELSDEAAAGLVSPHLQHALVQAGMVSGAEVNPDFIRVFTEKALEVLRVQFHAEAGSDTPFPRQPGQEFEGYTAMLEFSGPGIRGSLSVTLDSPSLLALTSRMLRVEQSEMNATAISTACELGNIVMGFSKTRLNTIGYALNPMELPVLIEPDFQGFLASFDDQSAVVVPLSFDGGKVLLEIRLMHEK